MTIDNILEGSLYLDASENLKRIFQAGCANRSRLALD